MISPPPQFDMVTRIERALLLLAYFMELDGNVNVPMYDKLEAELAALKATADTRARASQRLAEFRKSGGQDANRLGLVGLDDITDDPPKRRTKRA